MVLALGFGARAPLGRDLDDGLCDGHEQERGLEKSTFLTFLDRTVLRYRKIQTQIHVLILPQVSQFLQCAGK